MLRCPSNLHFPRVVYGPDPGARLPGIRTAARLVRLRKAERAVNPASALPDCEHDREGPEVPGDVAFRPMPIA